MDLPDDLAAALSAEITGHGARALARAVTDLSARYRQQAGKAGRFVRDDLEARAYSLFRLPATFAAIAAVLTQVQARLPDWQPTTMLDVGAGPGTATWAALEIWSTLAEVTLLEREPAMIALGKRLAAASRRQALRQGQWVQADLRQSESGHPDLIVAAYALGELPPTERSEVAQRLWRSCRGVLVVIEPGTPVGYRTVLALRDEIIVQGGRTLAPCPHDRECPMVRNDWCHFAARVSRSSLHRLLKQGTLGYEDEKYSYAALSQMNFEPTHARIIRHPQVRSGHVRLRLCATDGLQEQVVAKSDKDDFRRARRVEWGDTW